MTNAVLTWKDPTSTITAIEIAMQVQGAPDFTVLNTVVPGVQTLSVPDLVDGVYTFRAVAVNGAKRSKGVTAMATVDTTVAPDDVTELAVTLT